MKTIKIKRIDPMSLGKIEGGMMAFLALIFGIIFGLFMLNVGIMTGQSLFVGMAIGMIIILPLLYGFFGLIFGVILAGIFNFVAGKVGGLEIEIE